MSTQLPETCRETEINMLLSSVQIVGFIWKRKKNSLQGNIIFPDEEGRNNAKINILKSVNIIVWICTWFILMLYFA